MAEIIQFPTSRIVRRPKQIAPKLAEKREQEVQIAQFVEDLTEQLSMQILATCQENVVHMKGEPFLRDLAIVIEGVKSLLYRDFGKAHPMQRLTDTMTQIITMKTGQKVTDINYSKLSTNPPQTKYFADVEKQGIALADKAGIGEEYKKVVKELRKYINSLPKTDKDNKLIIRFEQKKEEKDIEFEPTMDLD
tara:strand:+ start:363 stop:938 length:576 start_codon:yes stop_codon:yes gene_type:complete